MSVCGRLPRRPSGDLCSNIERCGSAHIGAGNFASRIRLRSTGERSRLGVARTPGQARGAARGFTPGRGKKTGERDNENYPPSPGSVARYTQARGLVKESDSRTREQAVRGPTLERGVFLECGT